MKAKREGKIEGVKVSSEEEVTHTLFVDDVMLFGVGTKENIKEFAALRKIGRSSKPQTSPLKMGL